MDNDDRLKPLLNNMSKHYFGQEFQPKGVNNGKGQVVTHEEVDQVRDCLFPSYCWCIMFLVAGASFPALHAPLAQSTPSWSPLETSRSHAIWSLLEGTRLVHGRSPVVLAACIQWQGDGRPIPKELCIQYSSQLWSWREKNGLYALQVFILMVYFCGDLWSWLVVCVSSRAMPLDQEIIMVVRSNISAKMLFNPCWSLAVHREVLLLCPRPNNSRKSSNWLDKAIIRWHVPSFMKWLVVSPALMIVSLYEKRSHFILFIGPLKTSATPDASNSTSTSANNQLQLQHNIMDTIQHPNQFVELSMNAEQEQRQTSVPSAASGVVDGSGSQ